MQAHAPMFGGFVLDADLCVGVSVGLGVGVGAGLGVGVVGRFSLHPFILSGLL